MTAIETGLPSDGETVFEVKVSQLVSCEVQVPAWDPEDAHRRVTAPGFPLPPLQEWTAADDPHVEVVVHEVAPVQAVVGGGHGDGDGCAIYADGGYRVLLLDSGDPSGLRRVRIQDLWAGDQFVEPCHGMTVWSCVGTPRQTSDGWHVDLGDAVGERPAFVPPDCTCTKGGEVKPDLVQCGACGRAWCGRCKPTPGARCTYEYESGH